MIDAAGRRILMRETATLKGSRHMYVVSGFSRTVKLQLEDR